MKKNKRLYCHYPIDFTTLYKQSVHFSKISNPGGYKKIQQPKNNNSWVCLELLGDLWQKVNKRLNWT